MNFNKFIYIIISLLFIISCKTKEEGYVMRISAYDNQIHYESLVLYEEGKYQYFTYLNEFQFLVQEDQGIYEIINDTLKINKEEGILYYLRKDSNKLKTLDGISQIIYPNK